MTQTLYHLDDEHVEFPDPAHALPYPNGLLAIGGDLSPERLTAAYRNGIFPWFSEQDPILWWSPDPRAVIKPTEFAPSRSLRKSIRQQQFTFSINTAFESVIKACAAPRAKQDGTWIVKAIQKAYLALHQQGLAHSIEVWQGQRLVGGLYGVMLSGCFCGESMFHRASDASKAAFWLLCQHLQVFKAPLIDCQLQNPHLQSLGVYDISREQFLAELKSCQQYAIPDKMWQPGAYDYGT